MDSILQTVMSWYPNKTLYRRPSAQSGKMLITIYPDSWQGPVVSHDEWFSEEFRPEALEYQPQLGFFEQYRKLQLRSPVVALLSSRQENAEYCHDCEGLKDCYWVFDSLNCRDVLYSTRIYNSTDCCDAYWIMDSELIYDSSYLFNCHTCRYCFNCQECSDAAFLFDCRNVRHSFMCSNLRNKSYCAFNKQLTRDQYEAFIRGIDFTNYRQTLKLRSDFREMLRAAVFPPAFMENTEDCSGNYLKNCKNCREVFESFDLRDCSQSFQCAMGRDIHDSFMCNDRVELCRNCVATGIQSYNTYACAFTWHSHNMEFCYLCLDCHDCFGCWGLKNRSFCILNREYPEAEYFAICERLRSETAGSDFFPGELNPFPYEDTIASDFFGAAEHDLFQAEVDAAGASLEPDEASQVRRCPVSGGNFKIIEREQQFYEAQRLAFPAVAPRIRYQQKIQLMDTAFVPSLIAGSKQIPAYFKTARGKSIVPPEEYLRRIY